MFARQNRPALIIRRLASIYRAQQRYAPKEKIKKPDIQQFNELFI
jgi:hypothetical protein